MPITVFELFRFDSAKARWWAFKQMPVAKDVLPGADGLRFGKMLGTGAGQGFSIWPDWSHYALLSVWNHYQHYRDFAALNPWYQELNMRADSQTLFKLSSFMSRGAWHSQNPFSGQDGRQDAELIGVLTRASIKPKLLHRFWKEVPKVSKKLMDQPGKLFSKGVGEWPLIEQATFSIWENSVLMQNFAYREKEHRRVVEQTRRLNWYSEELFARFEVIEINGDVLFPGQNELLESAQVKR